MDKTPEDILAAIDKALDETAARLNELRKRSRYPLRPRPHFPVRKPETPEEIFAAIDAAMEETHRRLAETANTDRAEEPAGGA